MSVNLLESVNRAQDTSILLAARTGNLAQLKLLIDELTPDEKQFLELHGNIYGKNILHEAAQNGNVDVVEYCLEELNIHPDSLKQGDWTALMLCACKPGSNSQLICDKLIKANTHLNRMNKDGWTALHLAVRAENIAVMKLIYEQNKQTLNTISNTGRTLLHTAALHGHERVIDWLLTVIDHSTINQKDHCGSTAFVDALRNGHLIIAQKLVALDPSLACQADNCGLQPVHVAAECGQLEAVRYLVNERNIDVTIETDVLNLNIAHFAAKEGHFEIIEWLMATGKSSLFSVKCAHGRTALDLAQANGKHKCVQIMQPCCP